MAEEEERLAREAEKKRLAGLHDGLVRRATDALERFVELMHAAGVPTVDIAVNGRWEYPRGRLGRKHEERVMTTYLADFFTRGATRGGTWD